MTREIGRALLSRHRDELIFSSWVLDDETCDVSPLYTVDGSTFCCVTDDLRETRSRREEEERLAGKHQTDVAVLLRV